MTRIASILLLAALLASLSAPALFAQITLEKTIPGKPTSGFGLPDEAGLLDFNDDGRTDLALLETGEQGTTLSVVDAADYVVWRSFLLDAGLPLDLDKATVVGFFELQGGMHGAGKEIILAEQRGRHFLNPVILDADGNLLWEGPGKSLLTVSNMEADITCEVVVFNPQGPTGPQIEIWGE